jgi:hypothetical protein
MKKNKTFFALVLFVFASFAQHALADSRQEIIALGEELTQRAADLAQGSFEHFMGWRGEISDEEQAALFKSEAFAASCRLFVRLCGEKTGSYASEDVHTNLFNAFAYLARSFRELEGEMRGSSGLTECRNVLAALEKAFSKWPAKDNLAYLQQKYVQAKDRTVYLIERIQPGVYQRRPFAGMESLFRYHYRLKRGADPWKLLEQVDESLLEKMEVAPAIDETFTNCLVMEAGKRPNRPVYLIENSKKRLIASPAVLQRFGGWSKVWEIPADLIAAYPDGDPLQ